MIESNSFSRPLAASLLLPLALATGACGDKQSAAPTPSADPVDGVAATSAAPAAPRSARLDLKRWRSLLDEGSRAELELGGLLIDLGAADQHKYTQGSWGTGWLDRPAPADGDGPSVAGFGDQGASLRGLIDGQPDAVVVRARAADGEPREVTVTLNKRSLGTITVGAEWRDHKLTLTDDRGPDDSDAAPALAQFKLVFDPAGKRDQPILVDWVRVGASAALSTELPGPRVGAMRVDTQVRRSLLAATPRSFRFYMHIPADAQLIFDAGARTPGTEFTVRARTADGAAHELFHTSVDAPGWHEQVVDLGRFAGRALRLELSTSGHSEPAGWGEPALFVEPTEPPADKVADAPKPRNLVLVVLDTTRSDVFAPFAPDNPVLTPVFDRIAEGSTVFANAYNNENWTKPSVATIFSSLYPGTHDTRLAASSLPEEIPLLSEQLKQQNFKTAAFIGNAVVSDKFGFNRGWDLFRNDSDSQLANGANLFPNAAAWLDEVGEDERFFLYVQSIDAHTPYDVPREYSKPYFSGSYRGQLGQSFEREEQSEIDRYAMKVDDRDLDWVRALYQGEVAFQDYHLGALFSSLEERGLLSNTLVVITNDHGEEIREHGQMGHGWTLYEEMITAPLIMHYPPIFKPGQRVEGIVEHVDLTPTLLDVLGLPPLPGAEGLSFMPLIDGSRDLPQPQSAVAWSRNEMHSIRVGRWKLLVGKTAGWLRLFDLETDPKEMKDLKEEAPVAARLCEIYLGEAIASPGKLARAEGSTGHRRHRSREIDLDPKTRRQLEALGYL
ncbi:MAG: hypothetical protein Tsb0020_46030 [Haliangiales bacterium]